MRYLIAFFIIFLGFIPQTRAAEYCESCTPHEMFLAGQKAVRKIAWNRPHPPVYVANFKDGIIIKVGYANNVTPNFDWENDLFEAWGVDMAVEPQVLDYMATMHAALPPPISIRGGASLDAVDAVTMQESDLPTSVYQSITTPRYDRAISRTINQSAAGTRQVFLDWLKVNNPIPGFNPEFVAPLVRVDFEDGTHAYYGWDIRETLWERQPGTARDRFGNPIPEKISDVAGDGFRNYEFSGGSTPELAQFLYRLRELGVSVGTGPGTGPRTRVACSSVDNAPPVCLVMAY